MKYSLVNNQKTEPYKGGKGVCILCGQETIAKCGTRITHHWAHKSLINCDNWWENETEWHRKWKNNFPKEWQEIVHFDEITGEKHISDVKTPNGLVIEFQNSPMSIEELNSREKFYKKMIWILNGKLFKNNFHILHKLPNPKAQFVKDIAFIERKKAENGRLFFRYSENEENANMVLVHSVDDIKDEIKSNYVGHHLYDWIRPRMVWLNSNSRVFIDFDDDEIWELQNYDARGLKCVRKYSKIDFIKKAIQK
jgi:competence protein CoiA